MLNGYKSGMMLSLLMIASLFMAGCASPTSGLNSVPAIAATEYLLVPGDNIHVTIPDLKGVDTDYLIDQTGTISLPLVKDVKITGLTLRGAETAIEQVLIDKRILVRPTVSIQAVSLRPVYILGEVNKPGEYGFKEGLTIFSIVSLAGGYTYRADTHAMMVTRVINGEKITGKADENTIVMPGDQVRVIEKWF